MRSAVTFAGRSFLLLVVLDSLPVSTAHAQVERIWLTHRT